MRVNEVRSRATALAVATIAATGILSLVPAFGDPPARQSVTANLDSTNRHQALNGLDVFLPEGYRGPLPIKVRVDCIDRSATPALAVEVAVYGPDARLLNLTRRPEHGCDAYEVDLVGAGAPSGGGIAATGTATGTGARAGAEIGVGVHRSGPLAKDSQLKEPAVFVFNPVHGNWTEAKPFKPATAEPQRLYATLAEGRQRIIGGVIALPETQQAEPAKSSPVSLAKPLQQVNPADGYLAIDRIEPDSKGAYSVALPLLLRPSRGPGPSISIRYSSQGAPGVLGRGWDLAISSIEVRGSSPIYHPDYETEDYALDGMDLIALDNFGTEIQPLYKGGPILPRVVGTRVFRLRNNTGGLIVRRYGAAPGSYYWEIWDPHAHVTKLYGGRLDSQGNRFEFSSDGNGLLRQRLSSGSSTRDVIGQWGLTQEFDNQRARNGAEYAYHRSETTARDCASSWGACKAALRLDWVEYNKAFAAPAGSVLESGVTRLSFEWSERPTARFNSDGRLGFLRTYEFWLDKLHVLYRPDKSAVVGVRPDGYAVFAEHAFSLEDSHACLNFDAVLASYSVAANPRYDGAKSALEIQKFTFDYEGQRFGNGGGCNRPWQDKLSSGTFGDLPEPAGGTFAFPSKLLSDLGFGALAKQSLLGTSRTEETGASLYVGIGPVGRESAKEITVGFKGGVNFSKSQGNSILIDVTGDGIDDIVYKSGQGLRYCAGERDPAPPHVVAYPAQRCGDIEGINEFSVSNASTVSAGVEYYPGFSTFAGVGFNSSDSDTYVYFTDRDGDGLLDLVSYGQVFYGQGEDRANKIVRFLPRSSLTPPIPGDVAPHKLQARLPLDVRDTIRDIEAKLEAVTRRLRTLNYTQTTIAWEAPLDGSVTIAGQFVAGTSTPDPDNAGALGQDFGPMQFKALHDEVRGYQTTYIDDRFNCRLWVWDEACHEIYSDPFNPHYARQRTQIGFIDVPAPRVQVALSQKNNPPAASVVVCAEAPQAADGFDLAALPIAAPCQPADGGGKLIQVKAGDVLYLTYSVHPHFNKWLKPTARIAYARVTDDPAFAIFKAGDPNKVLASLGCNWQETVVGPGADCLLARQTRYEFDLLTGTVASAPGETAGLPPGQERKLEGRFEIPADLVRDYRIFFDVLAARVPDTGVETRPDPANLPPFSNTRPATSLRRLFRQEVSADCGALTGSCTVDIAPQCDPAATNDCTTFATDPASQFLLAARIVVEHRAGGSALQVRNIDQRLSALSWRKPPQVTSVLVDPDGKPKASGARMAVYLPIAMGDPDLEYLRVEEGKFANPDTKLTDQVPEPGTIDFKDLMTDERRNVELARLRQTVGLCDFATEIMGFLGSHFSANGQPYAEDYMAFWKAKVDSCESCLRLSRHRLS